MPAIAKPLAEDQRKLIARADRSADVASRVVRRAWNRLMKILDNPAASWHEIYAATHLACAELRNIPKELADDLHDVADHARTVTMEHVKSFKPRQITEAINVEKLFTDFLSDNLGFRTSVRNIGGRIDPIFRPLDRGDITRIVYAGGWRKRLSAQTGLANPAAIASIITNGFARGLTPRQIAAELRPSVQGVQVSARRIARTESVRVAHEIQLDTYEQVPGVAGYEIHSMKWKSSRWWHVERNGTKYYRNPVAGQKGFDKMPRPPLEAPDVSERPPGTPEVAHNCLCWLTPFFE